jgi:hypothetical protein
MRLAAMTALAFLAIVASALAGTTGTWSGRLIDPGEPEVPSSAYAHGSLVVGATAATARFTNHTLAAHDSPSATSTCSMKFRYTKTAAGWRYYAEVGRPVLVPGSTTTGGMPDLSMCSYTIVSGGAGIRIRAAGAKLRVEFNQTYGARWDDPALRGYLTR